ncbi:MAG TPA: hypothetical protein VG738_18930 [Chitinophagaceae bacterium]|nr:hypothetical protein [Chitinophagaceae bacterium]
MTNVAGLMMKVPAAATGTRKHIVTEAHSINFARFFSALFTG